MLKKIIMFILGILITAYSLMFNIIYLNLFKMGYDLKKYIIFVIAHFECMLIFIGIFLIILSFKMHKK